MEGRAFFFFCNMLGVNVAKSSLHLHFLKTLEFRTDVSVTSISGVAGPSGLATSHLPSSLGDPRPETQSNTLPQIPLFIVHPSKVGPCQHDLWASDTRRSVCVIPGEGRVSVSPFPETGSKCTTSTEGPPALPQPGPLGLR